MAACAAVLAAGLAAGPVRAHPRDGPRAGASIIGGSIADPAQWPFAVTVLWKGRVHCGGSVIAPTKVLTAAHCAFGFKTSKLAVVAGRPRLRDTSVGEVIPVLTSVIHPDYARTGRHDVAVLTLASPTSAPPVALASPTESNAATVPGALLRVAGWGARNPLGFRLSMALRSTTEKARTNRRCRRIYRSLYSGRSMICALGARRKRPRFLPIHTTACSGDSGGPLVADTPGGPLEVGTVSYGGAICGYAPTPTVYSRVSDSLPFINAAL